MRGWIVEVARSLDTQLVISLKFHRFEQSSLPGNVDFKILN